MSRLYKGSEPCPGCNKTGEEAPRWYKNELCSKCKDLLKLGKGVKEQTDRFVSIRLGWYTPKRVELRIKDKGIDKRTNLYALPYISCPDKKDPELYKGTSQAVMDAMNNLVKAMDLGDKSESVGDLWMEDSHYDKRATLPEDVAIEFFNFYNALVDYTQRIQKKAFDEGCDLLGGLNSGKMTLEQFNERINRK